MKKIVTNFVLNILHIIGNSLRRTNEGGRTIRTTRSKKFKNNGKRLVIAAQLVAIWYLLILTGSYLTSDTGAYFNDIEVIENSLHAKWDVSPEYPPDDGVWEKSSLKEVSISGNCVDGITARFTNTGDSVDHETTRYEMYWKATGNPKDGEIVKTGTFPIPNKGEFYDIKYMPTKDGKYTIRAYHETGHGNSNENSNANGNGNGNSDDGKGPWSGEISITGCVNP